jgi:hypothetical protein
MGNLTLNGSFSSMPALVEGGRERMSHLPTLSEYDPTFSCEVNRLKSFQWDF